MHLVEVLSARAVPAAGVSIGITRRCPLSCAHCATSSTMAGEQVAARPLERFVASFAAAGRPRFLAMSGGEPLLRPQLVQALAERARAAGVRSVALTGMFFARTRRIPARIDAAIAALDHLSVSIDAFHEREVPRSAVLRVLDALLASGADVSVHLVGRGAEDPYLEAVTGEIARAFDGRVPMLVNVVSSFGRARAWVEHAPRAGGSDANPCAMAGWPVVGFDGTIVACGNDDALEGPVPRHLRLGHVTTDDWPAIRARTVASATMRAIRSYGPEHVAARVGGGAPTCDGYCATCMALSDDPALADRVEQLMARPSAIAFEQQVAALQQQAGAVAFARRHGVPRYAELVALGAPR